MLQDSKTNSKILFSHICGRKINTFTDRKNIMGTPKQNETSTATVSTIWNVQWLYTTEPLY